MCQATVYLLDQEIAHEVIWLEPTENGVHLATVFDEPVFVRGRVRHTVILCT